jgi:hypothetical protein
MKPGTQIVYVPSHVDRSDLNYLTHPDCEEGFVTSKGRQGYFVFARYWSKERPGELRTKANSEATRTEDLVERETREQRVVDQLLRELGYGEEADG